MWTPGRRVVRVAVALAKLHPERDPDWAAQGGCEVECNVSYKQAGGECKVSLDLGMRKVEREVLGRVRIVTWKSGVECGRHGLWQTLDYWADYGWVGDGNEHEHLESLALSWRWL